MGMRTGVTKEYAKPPVSTKEKKTQLKAKREADKVKAAERAKDIIEEEEEARALKSPEQEAAELEAELAHAWQVEKKEAEARRLQDEKMRAGQAFKARNWEEALALYSKCIELDPEDHIHWSNRAAVNKHLANFEGSLADATKSTELEPEFAKGWARIGAANSALERLDAAEVAFQHGLTLEPENVMCLDGIEDIKKKRAWPTEEDEVDALVKELQGLELTEIQSRTLEEGLDKAKVDKAKASETPKEALINLVLAYKYLANLIMVELQGLELPQLRARALQEGLDEVVVAEAANGDDPMGALTTIIVKHLSDDLVEVLAEAVEDSDEEYEHSDDDVDFEAATADESDLQLGIGGAFVAGANIDKTNGELVLPNGTRLGNRALNKFYKPHLLPRCPFPPKNTLPNLLGHPSNSKQPYQRLANNVKDMRMQPNFGQTKFIKP